MILVCFVLNIGCVIAQGSSGRGRADWQTETNRNAVGGFTSAIALDAVDGASVLTDNSNKAAPFGQYEITLPNGELSIGAAQLKRASPARWSGAALALQELIVQPSGTHGPTKINSKDGLTYVWIVPGTFQMGCSQEDAECHNKEQPAHPVTITKGLWMGQTLVTQQAYQRVTAGNPSNFKGANLPVEQVTWGEAQTYCRSIGGRLPTEAEWEYAARAGTTGPRYGELNRIAWYNGNSGGTTHEVTQKQVNPLGLYDMLGNVWQWTADWLGDYGPNVQSDPPGSANGQYKALRGGSWYDTAWFVRVSTRVRNDPDYPSSLIGFRCVLE